MRSLPTAVNLEAEAENAASVPPMSLALIITTGKSSNPLPKDRAWIRDM